MDKEELKKKILSIVRGAMLEADELPFLETTDNIADALISSGYVVDMPALIDGSMGIFVPNKGSMELYPTSIKEQLAAAEHRAEVAERAARDLIAYYCSYTIQSDIDSSLRVALQQAEKELAEEKKEC